MFLVGIKLNGIQDYIFRSNILKENIGASHITNVILFGEILKSELKALIPDEREFSWDQWILFPEVVRIREDALQRCEIVEIGGGGALLLFRLKEDAVQLVRAFSLRILLEYPGLKISTAILEESFPLDFSTDKAELFKKLEAHNKKGFNNSLPLKSGIMQNAAVNLYAAEFEFTKFQNDILVSGHSFAKIRVAQSADQYYKELIDDERFVLTSEIDKLGQNKEAGYIAIVQIDGNGIGERVRQLKQIPELRQFSSQRAALIKDALRKLIRKDIIGLTDTERGIFAGIQLEKLNTKWILPIRPLLNGGDDACFLCEGRIGMYLAERFVRHLTSVPSVIKAACAGVVIVKTHFPFYKAYSLAEELCQEAKARSRNTNNSFISFFYSSSTFAGSLEQIRLRTHRAKPNRNLYAGPYSVENTDQSLRDLKQRILHFKKEANISKNKVMKLRSVMADTEFDEQLFIKEITDRGFSLPGKADSLFTDNRTVYFDPIELMEFYPDELLNNETY